MTPCEKQVTLRAGDYIATKDLTEDDYHAVARAFMAARADAGEYPEWCFAEHGYLEHFGWSVRALHHCDGYDVGNLTRRLTLSQILNATNAGGEEKEMDSEQWVPEAGEVCLINDDYHLCGCQPLKLKRNDRVLVVDHVDVGYGPICLIMDEAKKGSGTITFNCLRPIPTEEDRAVEELENVLRQLPIATATFKDTARALYQHGYRKQPQPADDMNDPANWRAGDVVEAIGDGVDITTGREYTITGFDSDEDPLIVDDSGDEEPRYPDNFRFVRRP